MPLYNFRRETKLHVVYNNLRYTLDIYPDISFSQTFNETSVPVKTLHSQYNMFEGAVISKASPANFTVTLPLLVEHDLDIMLTLLRDYAPTDATLSTADLYVEANTAVYKLEKAVIESGTFRITMGAPLTISFQGSASKLSEYTGAIPGVLQARTAIRTFTTIAAMQVSVNNVVADSITAVTVELKNSVQWVDFATLQSSLQISGAAGTMFPGAFVVSSRTLSGTIVQNLTDVNKSTANTWANGVPLYIGIGSPGTGTVLQFTLPSVVYTNRVEIGDVYRQSFDFKMLTNTTNMASIIAKI